MYSYNPYYYEYLAHHGVKGMRWGIRRYQPYTHGQKGIFKNLKKSYKKGVRSLKKQAKSYEKEGDTLASEGVKSQIKDLKREYKEERRDYKDQFDAENYDTFRERVANTGSEKMVQKFREDLDANQLAMAVRRLQANKDLEKLRLRDVETEVKQEQAMAKMRTVAQGAQTVASVANAVSSGAQAFTNVKNALGVRSKYQKELDKAKLSQEQAKASKEWANANEKWNGKKDVSKDKAAAISALAGNKSTENNVGQTSGSYKVKTTKEDLIKKYSKKDPFEAVSEKANTATTSEIKSAGYKPVNWGDISAKQSDKSAIAFYGNTENYIRKGSKIASLVARKDINQTQFRLNNDNAKDYIDDQFSMLNAASRAIKSNNFTKTDAQYVASVLIKDTNGAGTSGGKDYANYVVNKYDNNPPKAGSFNDVLYQSAKVFLEDND